MESNTIVTMVGLNGLILVAVYLTDFIYEYGKLFKLDRLLLLQEYQKMRSELGGQLEYTTFLEIHKPCFWTKLVSCHLCFGFWVSLVLSAPNSLDNCGIVYILSQILFLVTKKLYNAQ